MLNISVTSFGQGWKKNYATLGSLTKTESGKKKFSSFGHFSGRRNHLKCMANGTSIEYLY